MDKEKDIWSKVLKEREKDFNMPVDDHVWEKIASGLPVRRTSRVRKLWIISSAAAALLLMLFLGRQFIPENETQIMPRQLAVTENVDTTGIIHKENWIANSRQPEKTRLFTEKVQKKSEIISENRVVDATEELIIRTTDKESLVNSSDKESSHKSETHKTSEAESISEKEAEERRIQEEKFAKAGQELPDLWTQSGKKKKTSRKLSLAFAMGNQTSSFSPSISSAELARAASDVPTKTTLNGELSSAGLLVLSDMFSQATTLGINNDTQENLPSSAEIDYKMPITASVLVRKQLGDSKWALETGLSYTHLASTERLDISNASGFSKDIDLDYLGIPLKVVYDIYQTDRLSLYVTAGGQVEKSVYGKETGSFSESNERIRNDLNVSELQWSLMGNVGLNYRLVKNIGLFVEPGMQYFFDDKSGVQTIRKDKPFNLGIQAGFRLIY